MTLRFRHLRTKLLVAILAVVCSLTTAVLTLVQVRMSRHVREELASSMTAEAASFTKIADGAQQQNDRSALLLADLPILKALLSTRDAATVQDGSAALLGTSGADMLLLEGTGGELLAFHSTVPGLSTAKVAPLAGATGRHDLWFCDGHLLQVSFAPVHLGPAVERRLLGRVALGNEISPATVAETRAFSAGSLVFVQDYKVLLGSLANERWPEFNAWLRGSPALAGSIQEMKLGGERYFVSSVVLAGEHPVLLFSVQSYDQATSFLASLNRMLLLVGVLAIVCGAVIGFVLSRQIIRPLEQLAEGARRLENGDFDFRVLAPGEDEVAGLTRAFERMRTSLKRSREDLMHAARLEAVGRVAGSVAHDFNNLVMVIHGYSDLLLESATSQTRPWIEEIRRAGDRASALTRQILAFSRKETAAPQIVDPNKIIGEMMKMIRLLLGPGIELSLQLAQQPASIRIDPTQLEQIVMNLAVNARDAMPDGGKLLIATRLARVDLAGQGPAAEVKPQTHVLLSVSDNGCGMHQETLERIFEPFFTTKASGKGTGLGLATVCHIVEQCQGHVSVRSEVGVGTTFDVYLPALQAAAPELKLDAGAGAAPASATILLVEDEEPLRLLAATTLQKLGYRVLQAGNGLAALAIAEQYPGKIDVVVTDLVMPRMGGMELVQQLRQRRSCQVVIVTGHPEEEPAAEFLGAEALLAKPVSAEALASKVRELCEGAPKAKGAAASS
jgi:signal transduction histidine kinase/ActR/RegA family two-component response regulator